MKKQKNSLTIKLGTKLGSLNRSFSMSVRAMMLLLMDSVLINIAAIGALLLRFEFTFPADYSDAYMSMAFEMTAIMIIVFWLFSLYNSLWRYASVDELANIVLANIAGSVATAMAFSLMGVHMYRSFFILLCILSTALTGGMRFTYRYLRQLRSTDGSSDRRKKRALIVGAGEAGAMVAKEMQNSSMTAILLIGFVDDDRQKQRQKIHGAMVLGMIEDIPRVAAEENINEIIVAIPTMTSSEQKRVLTICKQTGCKLRILPGVYELIDGRVSVSHLRDVAVEDLLGRKPVRVNIDEMCEYIEGKIVLVTGGAGSIGSELCRQIAKYGPKSLIIAEVNENASYELQRELERDFPQLNLMVHIASMRDRRRMEEIFKKYRPQKVFHAAAHKHVPLMESNPVEAVKNNVFGTLNIVELAHEYGVRRFVMISTDKAVNPTNVMGATKRLAEKIVQAKNKQSETDFVAVRFGNVLGSSGSVLPLFKRQIAHMGPVTVTHPDIIRYFMTIPEAVSLVLQAGAMAKGGEVFVLDMGEPVKITDLARDLIRLSGYEPGKDIKIEFTGLRPGEKLYEELLMDEEGIEKTENKKIYIGKANNIEMKDLEQKLKRLRQIGESENHGAVHAALMDLVETYKRAM